MPYTYVRALVGWLDRIELKFIYMLRGVLVRRWGIREHRFFGAEANRCGEAQQWQQSRLLRLALTPLICKPSRPHRVHRAQSSFYLICALFSTALAFSFSLFYIHTHLLLYSSTVHYIPVLAVPSALLRGSVCVRCGCLRQCRSVSK